jgi:hypothetical protein
MFTHGGGRCRCSGHRWIEERAGQEASAAGDSTDEDIGVAAWEICAANLPFHISSYY